MDCRVTLSHDPECVFVLCEGISARINRDPREISKVLSEHARSLEVVEAGRDEVF